MPAFGIVARAAGRPLALIDVGAGAGLNLLWDEFYYRYSNGSAFGTGMSPVRIDCEIRGPQPDIPQRFPEVADRVGIDLHPIDRADSEQYRWVQALIWPDHADRIDLLANARCIWLRNTPRVEAGDAIERLSGLVEDAPDDAALCVFHCHALNQFPAAARAAFAEILRPRNLAGGHRRPSGSSGHLRSNHGQGGPPDAPGRRKRPMMFGTTRSNARGTPSGDFGGKRPCS